MAPTPSWGWGVLGPGWIARRFVRSLTERTGQRLVAVASRDGARAAAFAADHPGCRAHAGYASLLADEAVDIVYIATPHPEHTPWALRALEAGKHVVVEKPLAVSEHGARSLHAAAEERGLLCMEAMWSAYLPKFDIVRRVLASGELGDVRMVLVDHGERLGRDHRIWDPTLAGGPLLDLGSYAVWFAHLALGDLDVASVCAQPADPDYPASVNGQLTAVLTGERGGHAVVSTTMLADTPSRAAICGESGMLRLDTAFYRPGPVLVVTREGERVINDPSGDGSDGYLDGLTHEIEEAARLVAQGERESSRHPWSDVLRTAGTLDLIRQVAGIDAIGRA